MTRERTLPELTTAHPEHLNFESLPDFCTVVQVAVYAQRSLRYVRAALRAHELYATQAVSSGSWRISRDAAAKWVAGEACQQVRQVRCRGG